MKMKQKMPSDSAMMSPRKQMATEGLKRPMKAGKKRMTHKGKGKMKGGY